MKQNHQQPANGNGTGSSRLPDPSEPPKEVRRAAAPDPEVKGKARRRQYTAAYKLRILEEADACKESGALGALLRREGLYSSHLSCWRRQRLEGGLSSLEPKKRGRKGKSQSPEALRLAELERENRRLEREKRQLEARLKRADLMLVADG